MEETLDTNPSEVVRWMEVPQHPNVFALGPFARQVTFASQQIRAFNLIWALFRLNRLAPGQRVAVVGAGLAGMTATVAALVKECHVDLFEQASQPCPLQRGNDIRFIHPNILRWPEEGSETARTDFPFLNWTAANVRGVIKQIDLQWKKHAASERLRRFFNYKVTRLFVSPSKSGPQRPWLAANRVIDGSAAGDATSDGLTPGYLEFSYDCVILAVGFGEEKSMFGVPFLSYWENDSLHQETGRGRRSILISGCGDGGLIDALRLRLRNFDHADFVRRFLSAAKSPTLVDSLRKTEREVRRYARVPDISLRLQAAYDAIGVPSEIQGYFRSEKRTDASVTLNSPAPGPLSFGASLLNRYATYLAMRYADLHYLSGRVLAERVGTGQYQVTFQRDDVESCETRSYDLLIIRHGPEGVIRQLIPDSAVKELGLWWTENEDVTTKAYWRTADPNFPHQFFREYTTETVPPAKDVLDLALATFEPAYREFIADKDIEALGIGERDGKAGFIATLKPGAASRQPTFYAGVLVQFVASVETAAAAAESVRPPTGKYASPSARLVSVGAGIYNYDAAERLAARARITNSSKPDDVDRADVSTPSSTGTLGCFAVDGTGVIFLISSAFVLSPKNIGEMGDRIFIEGQSLSAGDSPIARLARVVSATGETRRTDVDAASARLEYDVRPSYKPLLNAGVVRPTVANRGDRVVKMGRTSGLTRGVVFDVSSTVMVLTGATEYTAFNECMLIKGEQEQEFSLGGDGGAAVVRDDGAVVGLLIAGSQGVGGRSGVTVACSFARVLKALNLTLLSSQSLDDRVPRSGVARKTKRRVSPLPRKRDR